MTIENEVELSETIIIKLSKPDKDRLKQASRGKRLMGSIVRRALTEYLDRHEVKDMEAT